VQAGGGTLAAMQGARRLALLGCGATPTKVAAVLEEVRHGGAQVLTL
jgi:hypothetical protein